VNDAILLLLLLNFTYIGLLPVIFFKHGGKLNLMWWLTALPFLFCVATVIACFAGYAQPFTGNGGLVAQILRLVAVLLSVASICLISFTLGTHRIPIALWHQTDDAPKHLVTWGAYQRIRHPFYASFILTFLAAFLYCPQAGTLVTLVYGVVILNRTAAREEKRLSTSEFGEQYQVYMSQTGRFIPRWGRKA
jgi:protein-S-isoprenylcysteine O-methyltransferase Ste14